MIIEFVALALKNITHRKARSILTIIGITIGIASVVALISLGNSLTTSIEDQLEQLGTDKIFIGARGAGGASFGPTVGNIATLTEKDVTAIRKIKGVDLVVPFIFANVPVKYKGETKILIVSGIPAKDSDVLFADVRGFEIDRGRFFKDDEKNTVIIGSSVTNDIFEEDLRLKSKVEILGKKLKVVGVLETIGNPQDDASITMSMDAMRVVTGKKTEVTAMMA